MRTVGAHRRSLIALVVSALLAGCGAADNTAPDTSNPPTTIQGRDITRMDWTKCGPIECAELVVHASPDDTATPVLRLKLYRRRSSMPGDPRTLVLIGDRSYGYGAEKLASLAPVLFGADIGRFDVVSIAPRGSVGTTMPPGFSGNVGALDSVDDLEVLRASLGGQRVSVMAWGRGATIAATWMMIHPDSVEAMILDTPADPSVSMRKQGIRQIEWSVSAQRAAVKWCASHLSCPLNANTTSDLKTIVKHIRDGRLDRRVTPDLLARASTRALAEGDPRTLFAAITDAEEGDATILVELAGAAPTLDDASAACADVSPGSAAAIVSAFSKMTRTKRLLFHIGIDGPLYAMCADLPPALRPLGTVKAADGANGAKVMTVIARGDPTWPVETVRLLAKRMNWLHRPVASSRHLVIGYDRAATAAAVAFLTS